MILSKIAYLHAKSGVALFWCGTTVGVKGMALKVGETGASHPTPLHSPDDH